MKAHKTDLQPDNDQVPESYHANLRRRISTPGLAILNGNHIHEVQDKLHGEETDQESSEIVSDSRPFEIDRSSNLKIQ